MPRPPRLLNRDYRVALTCGCTIRIRRPPLHGGVRFGCPSGQGHGYQLAWTSWTVVATGQVTINPAAPVVGPAA